MSGHGWMQHEEHEGYAQLPDIPYWRAMGWNPSDPPPEPDLLRDKPVEPAPQTTETPPSAGSSAVRPEAEEGDDA